MNQYCVSFFKAFLILLLVMPATGIAQNSVSNVDVKLQLEQNIRNFCQAYAALPQSKDKNTVLKYFSPKSSATIFYFSVSDKVRTLNSTYDGFDKYLERVAKSSDMTIKYDVQDIVRVYVNNDVATTVFTVNYEIEENQGFHVKGNETITFGWKKIGDDWKVVHYTVLGTEDEKLKGTCLCEIYGGPGGKYAVRTTVPSGRSYNTSFNEFEVKTSDNATLIKASDDVLFRMNDKGEVYKIAENAEMGDKLGEATEPKGAILLIVKRHLYPDNCTNIKYVK